ncbi:MAG: cobalamin-dependent protein [Candidatus Latescibacteria bacterium]|nr:cobalamin-dependent protein [Candidatus Latescibacterota bacterium]
MKNTSQFKFNKISRILFIHPPGNRVIRKDGERGMKACVQPVGLAYLASFIREKGFETVILDCAAEGYDEPEIELEPEIFRYGLSDDKIIRYLEDYKPDLVCISCPQLVRIPEAITVANLSKKIYPKVPVVMGGASVSTLGIEFFSLTNDVDYIIRGEGEQRLYDLIQALNSTPSQLSLLDGLIYRDGDAIIENPFVSVIQNIDDLPLPAYDLLPMNIYFEKNRNPSVHSSAQRSCTMISSRGCPVKCYYCPVHKVFGPTGPNYRMRSNENVLNEIELLTSRYDVQEIQFEDSNFNSSIARTMSLSHAIGERFSGLRWTTPHGNQMSTLTPEVLSAMKKGGCYSLHLALESGNQEFLEKRKKSVKLSKVDLLLEQAKEEGFVRSAFFMIGFPEENRENIARTINYADSIDIDDIHFFIAIPFPNTEIYDICKQNGWLIPNISWRHFRYSVGVIKTEHFDPAYLQTVRRNAWLKIRRRLEKKEHAVLLSKNEKEIYG